MLIIGVRSAAPLESNFIVFILIMGGGGTRIVEGDFERCPFLIRVVFDDEDCGPFGAEIAAYSVCFVIVGE